MERCLSRKMGFYFILTDVSCGAYNLGTDSRPSHSTVTYYPAIRFNIILPTAFHCCSQILSVKCTVELWFSFTVEVTQSPILWVPETVLGQWRWPQHVACLHTPVGLHSNWELTFISQQWLGCGVDVGCSSICDGDKRFLSSPKYTDWLWNQPGNKFC